MACYSKINISVTAQLNEFGLSRPNKFGRKIDSFWRWNMRNDNNIELRIQFMNFIKWNGKYEVHIYYRNILEVSVILRNYLIRYFLHVSAKSSS
jgi:hypothetical protein